MTMSPAGLAAAILATQLEAQSKAQAAIAETLDAFRDDPRVAGVLDNLRDTQASPVSQSQSGPLADSDIDEADAGYVYKSDSAW